MKSCNCSFIQEYFKHEKFPFYASILKCMCIFIYTHTHTYAYTHTRAPVHIKSVLYKYIYMNVYIYFKFINFSPWYSRQNLILKKVYNFLLGLSEQKH